MASAEQLLNEAQYAFHSIGVGESRDHKRSASRATSLCRKIIRKFPASTEAQEAHAILRRLGEEAFSSQLSIAHRHTTQAEHHTAPIAKPLARPKPLAMSRPLAMRKPRISLTHNAETVSLNWAGLLSVILGMPRIVLGVLVFFGFILFGIFGVFLFLPLIAFVLLTGPFRQVLNEKQRRDLNVFVTKVNAYIEERLKSNSNLA